MKDQKGGQISINQNKHINLNNTLLFQGKEHIFSFIRDEQVEGGVIMFHPSFLLPFVPHVEVAFPFFNISSQNFYHLSDGEKKSFEQLFNTLIHERKSATVVKLLLLAFLEKAKLLYDTYGKEEAFLSKKSLVIRKYKNLINNYFIEHKDVHFYANQLNISANYLNEIVKSETGFSAKNHISDRVLLEAKNLLLYSEMDIAEISHVLQFSEPTHFTKFFKKGSGQTPKSFRKQKP
ncbi:MAG: helix-turn-helix domain-containing protein [Flammeovirgaceae bacterium]